MWLLFKNRETDSYNLRVKIQNNERFDMLPTILTLVRLPLQELQVSRNRGKVSVKGLL